LTKRYLINQLLAALPFLLPTLMPETRG